MRRILEHELIHHRLWREGARDWGHTAEFRRIAWEVFGHQSITHGIGAEDDAEAFHPAASRPPCP